MWPLHTHKQAGLRELLIIEGERKDKKMCEKQGRGRWREGVGDTYDQ